MHGAAVQGRDGARHGAHLPVVQNGGGTLDRLDLRPQQREPLRAPRPAVVERHGGAGRVPQVHALDAERARGRQRGFEPLVQLGAAGVLLHLGRQMLPEVAQDIAIRLHDLLQLPALRERPRGELQVLPCALLRLKLQLPHLPHDVLKGLLRLEELADRLEVLLGVLRGPLEVLGLLLHAERRGQGLGHVLEAVARGLVELALHRLEPGLGLRAVLLELLRLGRGHARLVFEAALLRGQVLRGLLAARARLLAFGERTRGLLRQANLGAVPGEVDARQRLSFELLELSV
mmetsp:Transcript_99529/g.304287  ORF Transcript_99529/g.304287 Transcript_99529/m.304287 type:complete len:289 (+) Transcript_99529:1210-2076(+)